MHLYLDEESFLRDIDMHCAVQLKSLTVKVRVLLLF